MILLMNLAMYLVMLAVPIWMANQTGWTSTQTGLALAVMTILLAVCSPVGGSLTDRWGRRLPDTVGLFILTFGIFLLTVSIHSLTYPFLVTCMGLVGAGIGLCSIGVQTAALEAAGPSQTGLASGISSMSRYLGGILGSMLLTGFFGSVDEGSFQQIFTIATLVALTAMMTGLGIPNSAAQQGTGMEPATPTSRSAWSRWHAGSPWSERCGREHHTIAGLVAGFALLAVTIVSGSRL